MEDALGVWAEGERVMPKLTVGAALLEKAEHDALFCASCPSVADEGSQYCFACGTYWTDVDDGLWDDPWSKHEEAA